MPKRKLVTFMCFSTNIKQPQH